MGDKMERIVFHIDVNNAFLSWTAIDLLNNGYKIDIRNIPSVIGREDAKQSAIITAKSTPAKELGIKTADTIYSCKQKCKDIKVFPPNYALYMEMSNSLFELLKIYSPDIEIASIDECYLDYGKVKNLYGDELEFAKKLQKEIYDKLKFTVNIGIANNKLCAKMASEFSKPNKIHTLYNHEIETKMWPLKIIELFGIGKKTAPKLEQIGIKTIKDLANYDSNQLYKYFKNQALPMIESAKGIDNSPVINYEVDPKGIGHEITLSHNTANKQEIHHILLALSERVGIRLRKQNKYASVIVVILKNAELKKTTHQRKIKNATNITDEIYQNSIKIFNEMWNEEAVRLIGIRLDSLTDIVVHQTSLFENFNDVKRNNKLDKTLDELKDKYGTEIINKASLADKKIRFRD